MFKIIPNRQRMSIKVETSGLGTIEEVVLFRRELEDVLAALGWRTNEYVFLMHTLDQVIQTQAFSNSLQTFPVPARRIAIVKSGALASLQSRRILDGSRSALFATLAEAEEWLYSDAEPAVAHTGTAVSRGGLGS